MDTRLSAAALTFLFLAPLSAQGAQVDANLPTPPASRTAVQAALSVDDFAVVQEDRPQGAPHRWTAANPAQRLRATFSARAVRVGALDQPGAPPLLTLELVAWGRAGALQAPAPPELVAEGARIEYRRGPLVEPIDLSTRDEPGSAAPVERMQRTREPYCSPIHAMRRGG